MGHLWVLERRVDGETRTEARECLEVGGIGQRPAALSVYGESQRFEVLAVNVALPAVHGLQQVLAGNDLWEHDNSGSSSHTARQKRGNIKYET